MITVALLGFAFSPVLALAVNILRGISGPLQATWINQKLDSRVRATMHSIFGQVDAIGQITSGPIVGLIANVISVKLAAASRVWGFRPRSSLFGEPTRSL